MEIKTIDSFEDFYNEIHKVGFSVGGENSEGIFTIADYYTNRMVSHSGDSETDPWEWRIRGLTQANKIAYGKVFFKKSGWINQEWYPYFLAIRRGSKTLEDMYEDGMISSLSNDVYKLIEDCPGIALHELKLELGISKNNKSEFDRAITDLQMKLFITISGQKYKLSSEANHMDGQLQHFVQLSPFGTLQ